jgi:phosphoglycerol transferase MdoB-like AlkP superfamily enzyme
MLGFYAVCRLLFFAFNSDLFPNVTVSGMMTIMTGGLMFDISALLYINMLFFLLALLPLPFKFSNGYQATLKWLFIVTNSIGLALNVIDFKYYPFILKRTTANVADILQNETNMGSLFGRFLIDYWYVLLIFIALVYALIKLYSIFKPKPISFTKQWLSIPVGVVAIGLFAGFTVIGIRGGYRHSTRPITLSNAGDYVQSPEEVAIVINTPFSILRTIGKKTFVKMNFFKDDNELNATFTPVVQPSDSISVNKKNVVIILLESFSREHFGVFNPTLDNGTYKGYTPFLDSLAQQSLVFTNAFANGRKSIDALPSVTTSLPALVLPYVISEYSSNKVNSLASLLGTEGYQSAFFHGAPNGSMGFSAFTNMTGFQRYVGKNEFNDDRYFDGMWGIWDEEFFQFFGKELNTMQQPFFTTIFSVSSHHPFEIPERYTSVFPEGKMPLHKCVRYTDNSLRLFFEKAKQQPWFKNTLFVITADHSTSPVHEEYMTNVNAFAIPLIFYTPNGSLKGVETKVAQQIDIMPSVLSYLGYSKPYISFGSNLFANNKPTFVINYIGDTYQFIQGDMVIYFDGKKTLRAFNFIADPALKNDLLGKVDITSMETRLKAILQQYNNRMIANDLVCK